MQSFKKVITRWKQKAKKYFFSFSDGFYHLYILSNSPQLQIYNFAKMPFVKYDPTYQTITTSNPFLKVKLFHITFDEGLLLMLSDAYYKKNVMDCMMYDEEQPTIHYFISLKVSKRQVSSIYPMVNGTSYSHNTWSICKPAGVKNLYHFKDSYEQFYTLYFTKSWLDNYLSQSDKKVRSFMHDFLNSEATFMLLPRLDKYEADDYSLFSDALENSKPVADIDQELFRKESLQLFEDFVASVQKVDFQATHLKMTNELRLKILQAEHYLSDFYFSDFPGVERLAEKVGISETGLKMGFKQLFGCSVYKYYRAQKMKIARSILEKDNGCKIKEVAALMGYENAAKFAAAFKEETGQLPSNISNNE